MVARKAATASRAATGSSSAGCAPPASAPPARFVGARARRALTSPFPQAYGGGGQYGGGGGYGQPQYGGGGGGGYGQQYGGGGGYGGGYVTAPAPLFFPFPIEARRRRS